MFDLYPQCPSFIPLCLVWHQYIRTGKFMYIKSCNGNIIYTSIALMFLFCFLDNIIDVEEGKHAIISWITKVHRTKYNVAFNQLSSQTDDLIYAEGKLQKNSTRYKYLTQIERHIQFTLTQVNKSDVGLYKSMSTSKWPSIDGCALLVMKGM